MNVTNNNYVSDVTNNNHEVSESSDSEDDSNYEDLDDHEFVVQKNGDRTLVRLESPPYIFLRKKDSHKDGGRVTFVCNGCKVYAHATKHIKENGEVSFTLLDIPKNHICSPSPVRHLIARFKRQLKDAIAKEPTKSINEIYSNLRDEFSRNMTEDTKIAFIQDIPSFEKCNPNLYTFRKCFIPNAPKYQSDLDTNTPFFKFDNGENAIKIDKTLSGGRRIIGVTSDAALEHLARAMSMCIDGTFKISPKLWYQVLIIGGEVVKDTWIPILFAFLPDKKLDSYMTVFEELEALLAARGLALSAQWSMSDFEINIRKAVSRVFTKLEAKGKH
jgi:hypothetical protein